MALIALSAIMLATLLASRYQYGDFSLEALTRAQQENSRLALLLMDLNEFKEVNNTLGHYNDDRLLKQVATRLQGVTREPNTVARLGGDEFAILLPKVAGQEAAVAMAHKLLRALHMLNHIAGIGVRLSIDDFGAGYSSLSYLSKLPVCELKIDKSFVVDMVGSDSDTVIVRTTVDLGHNLGLKVVAEGVESEAILARLKALGCDGAQGYHIGYPLSEANFASWIKQTNWASS